MPALPAAVLTADVTGTVLTAPAVAQSEVVGTTTSALAASRRELVFQMSYNAACVAVVANGQAMNRAEARESYVQSGHHDARATASGSSWRDTADSFRAQAAKWRHIAEQARKAAKDAADRDLGDR